MYYETLGDNTHALPTLMLHGLFGSWDNLGGLAKQLKDQRKIYAVDLRNHGRSFHSPSMDYPSMAQDVIDLLDQLQLDQINLIGHSMGGKVAMQIALTQPTRVRRLAVLDIAPLQYSASHQDIFDAFNAVDLTTLSQRKDAEKIMASKLEDPRVIGFLLKNLQRHEDGFQWRSNLKAIEANYPTILDWPESTAQFLGEVLFVKGSKSTYISEAARPAIAKHFPNASAKIIPGTGHWLHAEKPVMIADLINRFLEA